MVCPLFFSSCSSDNDDDDTTSGTQATIYHYSDIELPINVNGVSYYSTELNKVFNKDEITPSNAGKIDIAFGNFNGSIFFFENPNESSHAIEGLKNTIYRTDISDDFITEVEFNNIKESGDLTKYNFAANEESFTANHTPVYVLFRNGSSKTGVIKVKSISSGKAIIDIKVQK